MTSAERQRLAAIGRGRGAPGLYLLEGPKAVRDALATGHVVEVWRSIDLEPALAGALDGAAAAVGLEPGLGRDPDFDRLGATRSPQGALAVVRDPQRTPAAVLEAPGWVLWLDGIQDPGNVGAIVRVAVAFGATGLLVSAEGGHPLGGKALRASAGLALAVPFARASASGLGAAVEADGRPTWLLEAGGDDVFEVARAAGPQGVLIVGSEGRGPSDAARAAASRRVGVPLAAGVESLNAAVAVGVAFATLRYGGGAR